MTVSERLTLPENLIYAWRKALQLYRMADGYVDRAELAEFEINLERELATIHAQLESGTYKLRKLKPLPRPKKLDSDGKSVNRQYFHVSVRDQVAWIALANSLGPQLDQLMPSWSYGNRLYRPAWYEDDGAPVSKLEIGPYRHASGHLYRKFQHSWPIFRRHVALSAKYMVKPITRENLVDETDQWALASAEKAELPYTKGDFWRRPQGVTDLYHASIDLKLFYPSINSRSILRGFIEFIPELKNDDHMVELLKRMLRFKLDLSGIPEDIIQTTEPLFTRKVRGIPTGLFVAGFLSNVAMLPIDLNTNKRILKDRNIAHFRYVDDHTFVAYDFDTLCEWIDWYKECLADMDIGPEINEEKYDPESLAQWMKADERMHTTLQEKGEIKKKDAAQDCQIDGRNPTKLLTKTLGQVSAIVATNADTLADKDLEDRLKQLEWLLLADIPEREIRPDTRAAFAAGQIANLAPIIVLETNSLVDEARKLAKLQTKKIDPNDKDENERYTKEIEKQNERMNASQREHDKEETKRIRHCFELLLQAFEEYPSKPRLFYRLLQYCRLTGYAGLVNISEWIDSEHDRGRNFWADYYCGLTLHILSANMLKAASDLDKDVAMWSVRDAAKCHIEDISKLNFNTFSAPKSRLTWFQNRAQIEFSISVKCVAAVLDKKKLRNRDFRSIKNTWRQIFVSDL